MVDPRRQKQLNDLLNRIGVNPHASIDWQLLDQALLHPSFSVSYNNDRLEMLGDSVLRLSAAMFLHENYGTRSVGELAAMRSHLVSDRTLAEIANEYGLDRFLVMANSARNDAKAVRSGLADALEALLAALYLSTGDLGLIRPWLDRKLQQKLEVLLAQPALGNYKVALQELTQAHWKRLPEYRTVDGGSDGSDRIFMAEVWCNGRMWGQGQGRSIKAAQQAAAAIALQALTESIAK